MSKTSSETKGYALRSSGTEKSVMNSAENISDKNMSASNKQDEQDIVQIENEQSTVQKDSEQNIAQRKRNLNEILFNK